MQVEHGQLDVLEGGGAGEQVETLEDEADLGIADIGKFIAVEAGDIHAIEQVAAAGGAVEASDDIHEGRFAGPAGPHDGDKFPGMDLRCDPAHGVDIDVPTGVVGFVDGLQLNDCSHG